MTIPAGGTPLYATLYPGAGSSLPVVDGQNIPIPNVGAPVNPNDAATMSYAQSQSVAIKTRLSTTLTKRSALQLIGVAAFDATSQTVGDFDRVDIREFGANPNGYFATTATALAGASPTLAAASLFATVNWALWHQAGAAHGMATPGTPVLAVQGATGASTISVKVVAVTSTHGYTAAGAATTIANANAALSATNFVECWGNATPVAGAFKYLFFVQFGGSGAYSYVGASIAHPQLDADGAVYPMSFRLTTATLPAVPPAYPATAPGAAVPNALRTQITAGGGTTTPTIFPLPISGATGTVFEIDNRTPFEDSQLANFGYGSDIRVARGTYWMSTDIQIWNPSRFEGSNAGKVQASSILKFRDGCGLMVHNPLTAPQWQPGTQYRVGERVVPSLRTGAIMSFTLTVISGGAVWGVSPTIEPSWVYTSSATTADANGNVWTANMQNQSAVGYSFSEIALQWDNKTIPVNRFVCPDDLTACPRNYGNGNPLSPWPALTLHNGVYYTRPTDVNANGKIYTSSGGTPGGLEPIWPRVHGATVADGTVTQTCIDYVTRQGAGYLFATVAHGHHVAIDGCGGTGLVAEGNSFSMGGNTNNSVLDTFDIRNCRGHHFVAQGGDGETSTFTGFIFGVKQTDGGMCSFQDNSNYGNLLTNGLCDGLARYQNQPWLAAAQMHSVLLVCYCEGGAGGETDWNGGRLIIGGNHGAGFRAGSNPGWVRVTGAAGPVYPVNSPVIEADTASGWTRTRLATGIDRAQFGSGTRELGTLLDEQDGGYHNTGLVPFYLLGGLALIEERSHFGARSFGRIFRSKLCTGASYTTEGQFGAVVAVPTQGLFQPGDYFPWVGDSRRLAIVPSRIGGLGSLGAWVANHVYSRGDIITQSGKFFEFILPGGATPLSAGTLSTGFASATPGQTVFETTSAGWKCWGNAQDPLLVAVPNTTTTGVAVTDAAHLVAGTGGLDPAAGPVFALAAPTANRAADLIVTGAMTGDLCTFQLPSAAFTWTINNTGGGGGSFVCPINTPATLVLRFDGTNWALASFQPAAILPRYAAVRSFSGTTDTVLAADGQGDVESTGAAAAAVTVPTMPTGFVVTYAQQGAGALSFTASGVTIETAIAGGGATTAQYQARTLFWRDATHVRIQ